MAPGHVCGQHDTPAPKGRLAITIMRGQMAKTGIALDKDEQIASAASLTGGAGITPGSHGSLANTLARLPVDLSGLTNLNRMANTPDSRDFYRVTWAVLPPLDGVHRSCPGWLSSNRSGTTAN